MGILRGVLLSSILLFVFSQRTIASTTKDTTFLQKTYKVNKSIKDLHEIYADLFLYAEYHPLIEALECKEFDDPCREFIVSEKPYSWFFLKINYNAEIILLAKNNIRYVITDLFFLHPEMNISINSLNESTSELTIRIEVKGPIFTKVLARKMMNAQEDIVKILNDDYLNGQRQ